MNDIEEAASKASAAMNGEQDEGSPRALHGQLKATNERIVRECGEAVKNVLEEYGCMMMGKPVISADGRIAADVVIAIKPE